MRVEIVDVCKNDAFYEDKEALIGQTGTLITLRDRGETCSGELYFDNNEIFSTSNPVAFHMIKVKPIHD